MIDILFNKIPDVSVEDLKEEIHIYYASQKFEKEKVDSLRSILSSDEIDRAERFYFDKDRNYYIVSRSLLRIILSKYLNIKFDDIHFNYNKFGKPEFEDSVSAAGLQFNLSHSNGKVIYALVLGREIGIDIEKVRPIERIDQMVNSFFSEKEKGEFNSLSEEIRKKVFWNCWTRKEAYIKAHGKGLSIPLDQFSISLLSEDIKLEHIIDGRNEGENWTLNDVKVDDEYICAVAYEGYFLPLVCKKII